MDADTFFHFSREGKIDPTTGEPDEDLRPLPEEHVAYPTCDYHIIGAPRRVIPGTPRHSQTPSQACNALWNLVSPWYCVHSGCGSLWLRHHDAHCEAGLQMQKAQVCVQSFSLSQRFVHGAVSCSLCPTGLCSDWNMYASVCHLPVYAMLSWSVSLRRWHPWRGFRSSPLPDSRQQRGPAGLPRVLRGVNHPLLAD